ncbi:MAG TPA: 5-dehydro-4-deoxyglucarate dehydratase [Polyangiaceae bacterium]|jgi:5-dehydro-4-deoxyglucarate dehydratase|nr:5-dehydro-4-deoxyglucarate dehydratase [Polyangiaceae bacterium]
MALAPQELRKKLTGAISFPVTPFNKDLTLDLDGLRKNLRLLIQHPIAAVVAPAGTGEMFSLSPAEHLEVVKVTVEEVAGKVPVLTGVGFNQPIAVELAKQSAAAGVDGILCLPPYYPNADDDGLIDYYASVGNATPLGLLIYSRDWLAPSPAWVEKLASRVPTLIAWKDGQANMRKLSAIMQRVGDRLQWIGGAGDDLVPAYYSLGIRCYTSSIANVAPKLSLQLHDCAVSGDTATLGRLMRDYVVPLYEFRDRRKGYEVSVMKEMMMLIGMTGGPVRPPLNNLKPEEIEELKVILQRWKPYL